MKVYLRRTTVFALLIMAALLTACGGASSGPPAAGSPVASGSTPAATGGEDWQQDTSPITIDWFVEGDWYNKIWDPENNLFDKMVTEATGVSVNFSVGNTEKLSAIIASGDLPDVITAWHVYPQVQLLQTSGLVLPLDELARQHAPTFKLPESMVSWHAQEDGHLYGFVNYFWATEQFQEGNALVSHVTMRARQDLMEQLDIKPEDFSTKAGTLEALRKVRDARLQYNGFDVVPLYIDGGGVFQLQQFFGARREDENGNYVNRDFEPETLEALKFLNQLYREGLLPQDTYTLNREQMIEKVKQGAVFAYIGWLLNPGEPTLYENDHNAIYVTAGPIKGDAGKPSYLDPAPIAGWTSTMITAAAESPERIIRFFEYMYQSPDIHLQAQFGPKGAAWDFDESGRVKYAKAYLAEKQADSARASLKYDANFPWFIDWLPIQRAWPAPTNPQEESLLETERFYGQFAYPDLPFFALNPQAGTDEGNIQVQIEEYQTQQIAHIVTTAQSEAEVEALFEEMIAKEKDLGYDRLYAWQNERFKAAKDKLNLQFAWPPNQNKEGPDADN